MKIHVFLTCLLLAAGQLKAQVVEIKPEYPQRGELVTVTYHPDRDGAVISSAAKSLDMVFSYSTFYELPWVLPMEKRGSSWVASFRLQRYATYATFYFKNGNLTDKPAADRHYAIPVYAQRRRVRNSYLHESYSLAAQTGRSPLLAARTQERLNKELALYPDNYEAKLRLLNNRMNQSPDADEKLKLRRQARSLIAAKFEEHPTVMGNLNQVTMGYLIIGENTRLDSVRQVVINRYPRSAAAQEFIVDRATKQKDTAALIAVLEKALSDQGSQKAEEFTAIHSQLFELYAARHEARKALSQLPGMNKENTPYTPQVLKNVAERLTAARLEPDTAIVYINRALEVVDHYPVGIIRFFPEFGYIPSFVPDSIRNKKVRQERADLKALLALNKLYLKDSLSACRYADQAVALSDDSNVLRKCIQVYLGSHKYKEAYLNSCRLLLQNPADSAAFSSARKSAVELGLSDREFSAKIKELASLHQASTRSAIVKQLLHQAGPEWKGIVDLAGKDIRMDSLKGKVVVMDFWATWCIPCMEELPYLQKVYERYKDHPGVVFMVVNSGARNTLADARGWAKRNGQYTFPIYFNNDPDIGEKVGFSVIPAVVLLDGEGKMQFKTVGFEGAGMEAKLATQIDILLDGGK